MTILRYIDTCGTARLSPLWHKVLLFGLAVLIAVWLALFVLQGLPDPLGTDFYPLWFGARSVLAGQDPYGAAVQQQLEHDWHVPFVSGGIAYPLPVLVAVMPLALLPLALAIWVWLALGLLGAGSAIMLRPSWRANVPILFLFLPFYRAAVVKQATLIWVGLAILLILFVRRGKLPLAGLCVALLPAKPQTGLFFALAAVIWALRHDRRLLGWSIAWAILIWGAALLLLPDWPWRWVVALMRYQAVVHPLSILPLGLLVLLASWRLPWYAIAAAAQVVFFPLSDLYSALPLVLGWVAVGGPLAWVGAGISWLWSLLGQPNNETSLWLFVLLPYCVCALLRALIDQRSGRSWPLRDSMTIYFARQVSD